MYTSTLLCLLPLLSPLSASALALSHPRSGGGSDADAASLEARALYDSTNKQIRDAHDLHARNARARSGAARSPGPAGQGAHGRSNALKKKLKKVKRTCAASASDTTAIVSLQAAAAIATAASSASSATSTSDGSEYTESSTASSTSTSSLSAAVASASATSSSSSNSSDPLFPWGTGSASWTTSDGGLSFTGALKPLSAGKLPSSGSAPDGSAALVASYPAGTVGLTSAGYSFYTEGEHDGVDVESASEISFSYSVYFEDGFEFNQGGKMPGLYGGTSLSEAKSCSGGRQEGRDSCFSARLMWRTDGAGEIYDYLPVQYTGTDDGYGESIDRGAYTWATGQWQTVAIRVKLNDVGVANGEQELYVDGESKISLTGVTFSTDSSTKFYGIMAQTFFGGHTSDWASPQDQSAYFKDWSLAILA